MNCSSIELQRYEGSMFDKLMQTGVGISLIYMLLRNDYLIPLIMSYRFYFDFSSTYVGVGMICPYIVNISLLLGAVVSWGIMWPIIETKKGIWYSSELSESSLHGIQGYRVYL